MARININNSSRSDLGLLPWLLGECSLKKQACSKLWVSLPLSHPHLFLESPRATASQDKIELFLGHILNRFPLGRKIILVILAKYPAEWRPRNCPADELLFCASVTLGKCSDPGMRAWECVLTLKTSLGGVKWGGDSGRVMGYRQ